jgi:hypothetical protein
MVIERQIELMILDGIIKNVINWENPSFEYEGNKYSKDKVISRYKELMSEFLESYVI